MRTFVAFLLTSAVMLAQASPEVLETIREGRALADAGHFDEARSLYSNAISKLPGNPDLFFEVGMVYFRQHDWAKAIENYRRSLEAGPNQVKTLFYLAESYHAESDLDQARMTIAQAAVIAPNDAQVCQKYGEYLASTLETRRSGIFWLQKARTLNPKLARIDFEIGKAQFDLTDFQSSAQTLELMLKRDPSDGEAAFFLAESWTNLGEWGKAHDSYTHALAHGYTEAPSYYGLGRTLLQLEQPAASLDPLQHSLSIQPSLIQAHFQLAKAYRILRRSEDSRNETELFDAMTNRTDTSQELTGADQQKLWRRVKPLLETNKEQDVRNFLAVQPGEHPVGYDDYLLGIMYYSMGRSADAERVLTIAQSKAPQNARIMAYLGMVQVSLTETAAARQSFEHALVIDPGNGLALIGMGTLEYQKQDWQLAIDYLDKSRTSDSGVLFMLTDAYFRIGKTDQAMLVSQVVRAFGSDRKDLIEALNALVKLHQRDTP